MAGAADSASGRARGPKGGCVSDEKVIVRAGGQLPPCPLPGGESGIRWSRTRPATLEEITRALDRIEGRNGRIAPPVDELERLVRDAFTALDIELTQESEDVARRAYPLFRDAASVEQRLAMIDESWSRGFDDDRWPASVFVTAMLENEPALVAAGAARYAAFVMMIEELAWDEIGRLFYGAEYESEMCRAATFLGMVAVGDSETSRRAARHSFRADRRRGRGHLRHHPRQPESRDRRVPARVDGRGPAPQRPHAVRTARVGWSSVPARPRSVTTFRRPPRSTPATFASGSATTFSSRSPVSSSDGTSGSGSRPWPSARPAPG